MKNLIIPKNYTSSLDVIATQEAIKEIKDFFQMSLAYALNLERVSAPLFVETSSGLNDNLTGSERPVSFNSKNGESLEIVQSLAKWKRIALKKYNYKEGTGLYADMNAIRRDEIPDNTHSYYVDQWDWEKVIKKEQRNKDYLRHIVNKIYNVFIQTDDFITYHYPQYDKVLPDEITFVSSQELLDLYPSLSPEEREDAYVKEKGAIFIYQIGHPLSNGEAHDKRSPDYDDWLLNGDIVFYNPILERSLELSSMGIRVDSETLNKQLDLADANDRRYLDYHQMLLNDELPLTIGGGIGQSRMCMFFMQKAHIGEVQASVWPKDMVEACEDSGIILL